MAPARNLPSSDEVGVSMLEQLLRHGGKQRMREMIEPPAEEAAEQPAPEGEIDLAALEQLLAQASAGEAEAEEPCPECDGKGCEHCQKES